ncbi:hypothetical protein [Clostridium gasigenes]|uniref:Uncharacterized protein n=1 Tax=Clostridium gasigenes TaxID=94869 RepID=A0A7X0VRF0_9CLOT|nr:hypothetical protein [Clostridium gasigenes]MBB6713506.1 hypothetical protein [Clostridium gasigenes]
MTKKLKIVSIIILTIIMIIGVKFGREKEGFFVDLQINKLYETVNNEIGLTSGNTEKKSYELQEDILKSRDLIKEFKDYTIEQNKEAFYNSTVVDWSVKIDGVQQIILSRIIDSINKAKQVKSIDSINEAKLSIPNNLPDKWKEKFEDDIRNIKIHEGLIENYN